MAKLYSKIRGHPANAGLNTVDFFRTFLNICGNNSYLLLDINDAHGTPVTVRREYLHLNSGLQHDQHET